MKLLILSLLSTAAMASGNPCHWSESHPIYHKESRGCLTVEGAYKEVENTARQLDLAYRQGKDTRTDKKSLWSEYSDLLRQL